MKIYKLYLAKPLLVLYLVIFIAFPLTGAAGLIVATSGLLGPDMPPLVFFVVFLGFALSNSYYWLRIPFEIKVNDNTVEFRNLFRTAIVPAAEIMSVHAKRYAIGLVDVSHSKGTVHLLSQMDGFHDFVATVKALNPAVTIKGC